MSSVAKAGLAIVWCAVFLGSAGVAYAAKDVVITTTGEKLEGEIQRVEKDVLVFSTDYSDSDFKIKWATVASIESERQFLVETFDGKRVTGSLKPDPSKKLVVQVADTSIELKDVVSMQSIERTFWSRFAAGLDFGYSMTRANSATQLSLGTNVSYRDEKHVDVLLANVFRSSQDNAPETQRWDLGNDFRRFLGTRWYVNTTQDFLNSEEQGLDLRTTIGGGGGRYMLRSPSQYLALGGGLAWSNENYTDPALAQQGLGGGLFRHGVHDREAEVRRHPHPVHLPSQPDDLRSVPADLPVRHGLQPAGRLVSAVRALRQLRQQAAGRLFEERLRVAERLRLQVLR